VRSPTAMHSRRIRSAWWLDQADMELAQQDLLRDLAWSSRRPLYR
jgi:hypothetical protein